MINPMLVEALIQERKAESAHRQMMSLLHDTSSAAQEPPVPTRLAERWLGASSVRC